MKIEDIAAMARAGFTKSDIARLSASLSAKEENPVKEKVPVKEEIPEWVQKFMERFDEVEKMVQTANIANNTRLGQPVDDTDTILGGLIRGNVDPVDYKERSDK